jgi:hypothetical protein
MINELKDSFSRHRVYKKVVPYIQDRLALDERVQYGIVVKNASASKVQLSADNFVGHVISYIQKANTENGDGSSIEWIREDTRAIVDNDPTGATFPSPAGVYYVNWTSDTQFTVNPLLSVTREHLVEFEPGDNSVGYTVTVETGLIHQGSLFVYLNDGIVLVENTHYVVNYDAGEITFLTDLANYVQVYADYHYPVESRGPYTIEENSFNNTAIPGVIMAFGNNTHEGDQSAIIVTDKRTLTALEYGGQWDVSISFDVLARDPMQLEDIADMVLMEMWGRKKNKLEYEGIRIQDISHGGESDEVYDETGNTMYYMASMDMSLSTDWNLHVPVPFAISGISFVEDTNSLLTATEEEVASIPSTLQVVPSLTPYMAKTGLNHNFERIL